MALLSLAYISRATFASYDSAQGIEPSVARILATSRKNNASKGIVGGLYYGNGYFFQYLEGDADDVKKLFERICKDRRHQDVRIVREKPIEDQSFAQWSMKYVPISNEIEALLQRHSMHEFDPYQFSTTMFEELVVLIRRNNENLSPADASTSRIPREKTPSEVMEQKAIIAVVAVLVIGLIAAGCILL